MDLRVDKDFFVDLGMDKDFCNFIETRMEQRFFFGFKN